MHTYLFYDIETTGLNKSFDQVVQFAAIRTDKDLNFLESYEYKVKLNKDVIPSPYALITHRIGISDLDDGLTEYEAIKKIHKLLNEPNTISLGYNTLGFDDEFLRFSFYRNLLTPYTHQFANNCKRMDIFPIAVMFHLFKNEIIKWPKLEGKTSLKLEQLNFANKLASGQAHDAMVDVKATLALAKLFFQEKNMWDYLADFFNKHVDLKRVADLKDQMALVLDGFFGADNFYQCPAILLGNHLHYKNQLLWLRLDTEDLTKTTIDNVKETTRVINKKPGEPSFILPMKDRFVKLSKERLELAQKNLKWLHDNPKKYDIIANHYKEYKHPTYENTDIDASLYLNGFMSQTEQRFCDNFHKSTIEEKIKMTKDLNSSNIKTISERVLARNFNQSFDNFNNLIKQSEVIDFQGRVKLTKEKALEQITEIKDSLKLDARQNELLDELKAYIT